jgi:AcrR family transcriptional regulator
MGERVRRGALVYSTWAISRHFASGSFSAPYVVHVSASASPTQPEELPPPRRKGRPRDASADERILAAAAQLMLTRGYDNMTVDEVAAVARAGKATVYRRWAGKEDLAFAALAQLYSTELPIPDTGSIREDLRLAFADALEFASSETGRAYLRMTVGESLRDHRVGALYTAAFEGQEAAAREMFERAIARGELRPDFRMDLAINWFAGLLVLYAVIDRPVPDPAQADDLIDFLLEGIGPR